MVRLSPRAERKLAKMFKSLVVRFFAKMHEMVLAKVTSSQPDGQEQEFIKITYSSV